MNTKDISGILASLWSELIDGPPDTGAYMLNTGDPGLLASLDKLSASDASRSVAGGATIAAHVEHLRFGISLMNHWKPGENPWKGADWTAAWRTTAVTEDEWRVLRDALRDEARRWGEMLREPRDVNEVEASGVIGNIAHLAYHVGAIRQIDRGARGPSAEEEWTLKQREARLESH